MSFTSDFYQAGGWPMHLILLVGISGAALSILLPILAFALGRRRLAAVFAAALAAVGLAAVLLGLVGQALGLRAVEAALVAVNPVDRDALRLIGSAEARTCLAFGLFAAILPWTAAAFTLGRAATARASAKAVLGGVALAAAVCALVGGVARQQLTLFRRDRAIGQVAPEERQLVLEEGGSAARSQLAWGLGAGGALAALGVALVAAGTVTRRGEPG